MVVRGLGRERDRADPLEGEDALYLDIYEVQKARVRAGTSPWRRG
jgi:hypothetical protein